MPIAARVITRLSLCAATGLTVALIAFGVPAGATTSAADLMADMAWVQTAAVPSGAITLQTDRRTVWPYVGNYAAVGLAAQAARTGDLSALAAAWGNVNWYAAAEGPDGVVTDYQVAADLTLTSTGTEDSTDAYAGTFLSAAAATYDATPSSSRRARLTAIAAGLDGALRAIESTQDSDGMTWAKPEYHVKYLMDQSEVYRGLRGAARLFSILGDRSRALRAAADAHAVADGVATLYDPSTGTYRWAKHGDGAEQPADLTNLYPDAMEQVWAVAGGLVPGRVAGPLMARVLAAQPDMGNPGATMKTPWGPSPVGYWPWAAKAFLAVGNTGEADALTTSIGSYARANGRIWPFTTGNAGQVLATAETTAGDRAAATAGLIAADRTAAAPAVAAAAPTLDTSILADARRWAPLQPNVVAVLHGLTDPRAAGAQLAAQAG